MSKRPDTTPDFQPIFVALRTILQNHRGGWSVEEDSRSYSLAGTPGRAALQAWGGKLKRPMIPIAWVQTGKAYVSYHLMGLAGNPQLLAGMSKDLKARMQGKTCFNFKSYDEAFFRELESVTAQAIAGFVKVGYVSEPTPA
jgi:hypothetical protein